MSKDWQTPIEEWDREGEYLLHSITFINKDGQGYNTCFKNGDFIHNLQDWHIIQMERFLEELKAQVALPPEERNAKETRASAALRAARAPVEKKSAYSKMTLDDLLS